MRKITTEQMSWLSGFGGRPVNYSYCPDELGNPFQAAIDEIRHLREALKAAGKSLHVIADGACLKGDGLMLESGNQIRGYARNRGSAAFQALGETSVCETGENDA